MNLDSVEDAVLITLIAETRDDALEELYERYNRLVFSVALAVVGERSVAEEVTLDVFMRVWRGAKTYRPERAKVSTWLVAIARHHAIDVLRWQSSRVDTKNVELEDMAGVVDAEAPDPEESVELSLQRQEIRGAFKHLPNEQRQVIVLAYFKGFTQQEIADQLAQPLGTVKTRIRLAMQKLRLLLSKEGQPEGKSISARSAYPMDRKK